MNTTNSKPIKAENATPHLANAILDCIRTRDYVSFVEIERVAEEAGFPAKGDMMVSHGDSKNLVLWANLSPEVFEALNALLESGQIIYVPVSLLSYMIDGGGLRLPVAKRIPRGGYTRPRWLPVVFRTAERVGRRRMA